MQFLGRYLIRFQHLIQTACKAEHIYVPHQHTLNPRAPEDSKTRAKHTQQSAHDNMAEQCLLQVTRPAYAL